MKLSAALEYEKLREDAASWNKVILHRDGKFYHAYDWSAWIIKQYVCTEEFQQQRGDECAVMRAVNSWLGVLSHYDSFNIKSEMFLNERFLSIGTFDRDMTVYELSKPAAA